MKQRLGLATTIIGQPNLILLDEPCSALDPIGRHDVLEIVNKLKENATVLFSTHILSDVETVCDSVTVVDHGKTLYEGTVKGISSKNKTFEDSVIEHLRPSGVLGNESLESGTSPIIQEFERMDPCIAVFACNDFGFVNKLLYRQSKQG